MGYYLLLQYFTFFSVANNQFSSAFILNLRKKTSVEKNKNCGPFLSFERKANFNLAHF